ncbi:hypothetical protein IM792_09210 [Mucilaginibacter sp. JRF]|uniref:MAC/perforin domain-containing protein n=1 Tax=Mucilaginibacter sp. JRF TaxID=2780088 RepID=UPI001880CD80|nr:MAC/perforin domain-containing protein [Mucilaginibacter sp. JRF]MBE9584622.1 hypothetical protein [Mucilaginibacter sp. JRF]
MKLIYSLKSLVNILVISILLTACKGNTSSVNLDDSIANSISQRYNTYYSSKTNIEIDDIPIDYGSAVKIGKGVNLENPNDPIAMNKDLLDVNEHEALANLYGVRLKADTTKPIDYDEARKKEVINYYENENEDFLAFMLQAKFGVKAGFASYGASLSFVRQKRNEGKLIIFDATSRILRGQDIKDLNIKNSQLKSLKDIESLNDEAVRYDRFVNQFGTHYINSITYGYSISIFGSIKTTSESVKTQFSAYFRNLAVRANIDAAMESFFSNQDITINAAIDAGGNSSIFYLTTFPQIRDFFDGLNSGKIKLYPTAVAFKATSFRPLINPNEFPKIYTMMLPYPGEKAASPFGVPKGTIIAYNPINIQNIIKSNSPDKELENQIPDGWAICDGRDGTPDLRNRFILAAADAKELSTIGGQAEHFHTGTTDQQNDLGGIEKGNDAEAPGRHTHTFKTNPESNIPPYFKVVYIIKL